MSRPMEDTGFRMWPTDIRPYVPRSNPPTKRIWRVTTVHEDDIIGRKETTLRGVAYITINVDKIEARKIADIRRNIAIRKAREYIYGA